MPYVIENTAAGRIEGRDISSLATAVLEAARYDGWGAEYARDSDGRMGLRCSTRHIGNNPWTAAGSEKPAYGCTSDIEDDGDAIEAVAAAIAACEWGGNMRALRVVKQGELIRERLAVALAELDGDHGPGEWLAPEADCDKGTALLCYKWPDGMSEGDPHWGDCDAPWNKWGGDTMIAAAGCSIRDGYGIDGIDHAVIELA